jgi:apolipoprotein N-acyltransferase
VDYNAALLFENGKITEIYRKMHLVPFTEHFPYEKLFPAFYRLLLRSDTHFWEKGEEATVFNIKSFKFSTPICFEDTFGYLSRRFVLNGADVLVNITNDAWANSLSSQKQHLSQAVFRAVENYRAMVRSTVSGQTCSVDPHGRIIAEAVPFTETWLSIKVPILNKQTIYTLYGDYLAIGFLLAAVIFLLSPLLWYTIKKQKRGIKSDE